MIQIEDNDSPITVAQKLIHGTKSATVTPFMRIGTILRTGMAPEVGEKAEVDMFSDAEIREIAAYLLTIASKECIPDADVAPVLHGRWEKKKDSGLFYCSECGLPSMHKWPYCERCGAKMDGERKE